MIRDAMDLGEFREVTAAISKTVTDDDHQARLTIVGFDVDDMRISLACANDGGVVLYLGDSRISLSQKQLAVLSDIISILKNSMEIT